MISLKIYSFNYYTNLYKFCINQQVRSNYVFLKLIYLWYVNQNKSFNSLITFKLETNIEV